MKYAIMAVLTVAYIFTMKFLYIDDIASETIIDNGGSVRTFDSFASEITMDSGTPTITFDSKTFDIDSEYMIFVDEPITGDMRIACKDGSYRLHPTDSEGIVYDPNIIEDFIRILFQGFMHREPNGITLRKD